MFYTDSVFWVDNGSNSAEESPQTTWSVILSSFVNAPLPRVIKRRTNDDHVAILAFFDNRSQPQIIIIHPLYKYYSVAVQSCRRSFWLFVSLKDLEGAYQVLIYVHKRPVVLELSTVIRCSEDCYQFPVPVELVPFLYDLMCATDQVYVEILQEFLNNVLAEGITDASLIFAPALDVRVGIGPQQIAKQALIRDFNGPFDADDICQILKVRAESAMHTDDLLVDNGTDGHNVEHIEEVLPYLEVVASLALIMGNVHSS